MNEIEGIRSDIDLFDIDKNSNNLVTMINTGKLDIDFNKYASNYFEAAELLCHYMVEEASIKHDIATLDLCYFPLVYLYRQSLELLLKSIICKKIMNKEDQKQIIKESSHNLKALFEEIVDRDNIDINDENNKWLMSFFEDITNKDSASDMFRYPFGNNFMLLFNNQTGVSLIATHDNMNRAYEILYKLYDSTFSLTENYSLYPPKLIIESKDYYEQSVVGYNFSKYKFYPYCQAYHIAASLIKDNIINQNKKNLFFPMCYLYRNLVEILLKKLILEDSHIEREEALNIIKNKHNIHILWNSIVNEIKKYLNVRQDDTTVENLEKYIDILHKFDSSSDIFRYPCGKTLTPYFLKKRRRVDIINVANFFEILCNSLECVSYELEQLKEYELEMIKYYN